MTSRERREINTSAMAKIVTDCALFEAEKRIKELEDEIDKLKQQKPVGVMHHWIDPKLQWVMAGAKSMMIIPTNEALSLNDGDKVYANPVPPQQVPLPSRKEIIDVLLSAGELSEGVTADVILAMLSPTPPTNQGE